MTARFYRLAAPVVLIALAYSPMRNLAAPAQSASVATVTRKVKGLAKPASRAVSDAELDRSFKATIKPFLATYCVTCHAGTAAPASFDLSSITTRAAIVQDFDRWGRVMSKLSEKQMPPAGINQPPAGERQGVIDWISAVQRSEILKHSGDPGVVLARRLSNAEYNYTIRDLTGIDMRPAKEFPVDPANQAGFDNSGESLDMSPELLKKYLGAAHEVADHMFLNLDGFQFSPYPMLVETDRNKYCVEQILAFYDRQDTDYSHYFAAAWRYKHRAVFKQEMATLASIAAERKVSARYLNTIWQALEGTEEIGPLAKVQGMWRALPKPKSSADADIARPGAEKMRDFVIRLRKDTSMVWAIAGPSVDGLGPSSQPLAGQRNRDFASHRRDFDKTALRVAGEAPAVTPAAAPPASAAVPAQPPAVPGGAGAPQAGGRGGRGGGFAGGRGRGGPSPAVLASRKEDPNLDVPAGERAQYEAAFAKFASVFPDTFYVRERGRSYPNENSDKGRFLSSGFHLVDGYQRDDTPLSELILDEAGQKELNRLWEQFEFVADFTAKTFVQFFFDNSGEISHNYGTARESGSARTNKEVTSEDVIMGFRKAYLARAEKSPTGIKAIENHFDLVNATIRRVEKERLAAEPRHLEALLQFAARAYRRPLTPPEKDDLLGFYRSARDKRGLSHEEAIRDSVVSVLMSPEFSFRLDLTLPASARSQLKQDLRSPQTASAPLPDYGLASRLSYFIWASMPDGELMAHVAAGDLRRPGVLAAQVRRMLKDDKALALSTEFGGNWLDFRRFEEHNAVDRERFPSFDNDLREAMFQEPIHFIDNLVRHDASVLDALYGNYTFVNPILAKHYGMPAVKGDPNDWRRIDNARDYGRGGILPMAVFLTENAPGLRTSPVKRGYWVARRVLGEVIPPPPAVVPELPKDEAKTDLPLREVLAQHRANPVCAGCHNHFDVFGLTMEGYGMIGERRSKDLAGRAVDTKAPFPDGSQGESIEGLLTYIRARREKDFLDNLSRKLLVYALGRSLILADQPLIDQINERLARGGYKVSGAVETIVSSPEFQNVRKPQPPIATSLKEER